MSKPMVHAESSVRKWGGKPEDYMPIHNLMDSSKGTIADSRHRALTHNTWFIGPDGPLEKSLDIPLPIRTVVKCQFGILVNNMS